MQQKQKAAPQTGKPAFWWISKQRYGKEKERDMNGEQ